MDLQIIQVRSSDIIENQPAKSEWLNLSVVSAVSALAPNARVEPLDF